MMTANQLFHSADILIEKYLQSKESVKQLKSGKVELNSPEENALNDYGLIDQATMLVALGIENMIKGIWINKNNCTSLDINKLPEEIRTHNLTSLCNKINLQLSIEEEILLRHLETYILWKGRYPIPLKLEEFCSHFEKKPIRITDESQLTKELASLLSKLYSSAHTPQLS